MALFWFLVTVRGAAFVIYTPTVLAEFGATSVLAPLWLNAVLFLVYTVVALLSTLIIDRVGRRSLVLRGWAIATAITVGMAFVDRGQVTTVFVLIVVSTVPIQTVTVALFPWSVEFFPTAMRGTAQGICSASGKLGGFVAAVAYPSLFESLGWQTTILVLASLMLVGLLVGVLLRPPETRGRSLEQLATSSRRRATTPLRRATGPSPMPADAHGKSARGAASPGGSRWS